MTDKLPPLAPIVGPSQTAVPAFVSSVSLPEIPLKRQETAEEEPYTIKCICGFSDDDGNTIYCETCDTWQHIECFYPDNVQDALREDFAHSCADCKPRPLDPRAAHERQKARILSLASEEETSERKTKRPPSKSHRKKSKPNDLLLNGHTSHKDEHARHGDHAHSHSHKKTKSTHKSSQSVSSQAPKRSPPYGSSKTNPNHPPSPATTPPELPISFRPQNYSQSVVNDHDVQIVDVNSFARLDISFTMSMWLRDSAKLERDTGRHISDVFQKAPSNLESLKHSSQVAHRSLPTGTPGSSFHYLSAVTGIEKDVPLLELNGQIGFQKDYCQEPAHRWDELTAPVPYVFFHRELPLYIDTRKEGSKARYVRRSCKPNSALDTYLTDGSEYHFWLVSERRIAAKEQITIPWDVRFPPNKRRRMLHILGISDDDVDTHEEPALDDVEYEGLVTWVDLILAEYGGCACDLGNDCAFVRFKQNYAHRVHGHSTQPMSTLANVPKKRARKPKPHHTISPTSTGHATNSRAASEGRLEGSPENDGRSLSGSTRSKPPSRDMTPTARQGSFDTLGILTEPTDRDKRKVAMVEDSFRRMEQQQPLRKKKRVSDGTGGTKTKVTSKSLGSQPSHMPNGQPERGYVDAGTYSGSKSGSPSVATYQHVTSSTRVGTSGFAPSRRGSAVSQLNYVDTATQTDPVAGDWPLCQGSPKPRRRIVSLSRRLLSTHHRLRMGDEERSKQMSPNVSTTPMDIDSPVSLHGPLSRAEQPVAHSLPELRLETDSKRRSMELSLQLPPVPAFGSSTSSLFAAATPLSATSPMMQSPFGSSVANSFGLASAMVTPSPIKKKMSLSDYKSRHNKAQAAKPSAGTASLNASVSIVEEPKSASSVDTAITGVSGGADKAEKVVET